MNRILTLLVILQSAALAGLVYQTFALQERLDSFFLSLADRDDGGPHELPGLQEPAVTAGGLTIQQLRDTVREELHRILEESESYNFAYSGQSSGALPDEQPANPELAFSLSQTLEAHIAAGAMSDADMASLQANIARLNPDERTRILRRLVRAMNSGQLTARL